MEDDYLCGGLDGTLQVFKNNQLKSFRKLHEKRLDAIYTTKEKYFFYNKNPFKKCNYWRKRLENYNS